MELQLSYDSSDTQRMVSAMQELNTYTVLPYPMVYLSAEDQARVNEIQLELGSYSETAMIRFVTGDIPWTIAAGPRIRRSWKTCIFRKC